MLPTFGFRRTVPAWGLGLLLLLVGPVLAQRAAGSRQAARTVESFLYDFVKAYLLRDWNALRRMTTASAFEELKDGMAEIEEADLRQIREAVRGDFPGLYLKFSLEGSGFMAYQGRFFRYYEYEVGISPAEERMEEHPLADESFGPFLVVETPNGWVVTTEE